VCTAATYKTTDFYFGQTLDYESSYGEEVTVTPRNYPFAFRGGEILDGHYAIIGMAHVVGNYPLYYDAVNEKGLAMAGLNFPGNACYKKPIDGKRNVAAFEFVPYLLCKCASVDEAKAVLANLNLTDTPYSSQLPPTPLHWIIADRWEAITVEATKDGLRIYPNSIGVLTNNPPFDMQMQQLANFMHLSPNEPESCFSPKLELSAYSRGMGAIGLPGDLSSQSRFVRAAFTKENSVSGASETESVHQFFHILGTVAQTRGCCRLADGSYEITIYTSCCNADKGIYYYTTYDNQQIIGVDMHRENLDGNQLSRYPLKAAPLFYIQNAENNL